MILNYKKRTDFFEKKIKNRNINLDLKNLLILINKIEN